MARGRELFVDTSAWYVLVVPEHQGHARLAAVLRERVEQGVKIVTSSLVVAETHALLLRRVGRDVALRFAETVGRAPNEVVPCSAELESAARRDWLAKFGDQDFSLTDAVSFAIMRERGATDVLALDRHFAAAGFVML